MLSDYIDQLPEDKREAFKAEISKAVVITTEAEAEAFADSNALLKKANQRYRDGKLEETKNEFLKNFKEKELPALLEAERKKGEKTPLELRIEQMEAQSLADKRELALEKQKARAFSKAQTAGVPLELAEKFIGETDDATDAALDALFKVVLPYRENAVKEALKNVGSQPKPQGGKAETDNLAAQYDAAIKSGNMAQAIAIKDQMSRAS